MSDRATDPSVSPARFGYAMGIGLICAFAAGKAVWADSIDPDFFWHLRVADQLLEQGIGPIVDQFSFMSSREPWTPFSWLGELLMKWTYDAGGLRAIVAVHALCSVTFFYFLARACDEAARSMTGQRRQLATFFAILVAALFSLPYLSFRPVTMAIALLAAMTFILWRDRRVSDRRVWLLVPMTIVLTNLHLYVILWIAWLWARWVGLSIDAWNYLPGAEMQSRTEQRVLHDRRARVDSMHAMHFPVKRQFFLAIACTLAALCTPMLPGCIRTAFWFGGEDPMVKFELVSEILPFHGGILGKLLAAIVLAHVFLAFRTLMDGRREAQSRQQSQNENSPSPSSRFGFEHLFTLAAAIVFLLQMGRFSTVYALMAMPLLAAQLPYLRDLILERPIVRITFASALAFCIAQIALSFPRASTAMEEWITRHDDNLRYPTGAARFVDEQVAPVHGRVLNELTWGGYLIWRLGERFQVFMDGRTLIYPASFWTQLYLENDDARVRFLSGQRADAAILPTRDSRLAGPLQRLGWTAAYADDRAIVLLPPAQATTDADR